MVRHIVIFKLNDVKDGPMLKKAIEGMDGKIPGLISIEAGLDFSKTDGSGDLVLISDHETRAALNVYQDHPNHVKVKDLIIPRVSSRIIVDYNLNG